MVCAAQSKGFNHLPPQLRHARPAANAAEQRAREEAIFRYYAVPITHRGEGTHHPAVRIQTKDEHTYRTRFRDTVDNPPTFADTVATDEIGCGTGCFYLSLVDRVSGAGVLLPYLNAWNANMRADRRRNSRALHIMGYLGQEHSADRWYVWENGKLTLMALDPIPDDCFASGEDTAIFHNATCHFAADTDPGNEPVPSR